MTIEAATDSASMGITMSDACVGRLRALLAEDEYAGMTFRVSVGGGGCSGFQYSFSFDDQQRADDRVVERDGIKMLVDEVSWDFLAGSEVHFEEELVGSWFTVRNPNASSTCGCGTSFAIG